MVDHSKQSITGGFRDFLIFQMSRAYCQIISLKFVLVLPFYKSVKTFLLLTPTQNLRDASSLSVRC